MDDDSLKLLDSVQKKLGYKSRSKLLRSTINSLINEYRDIDSSNGHTDAVITLTYIAKNQPKIHKIVHRFEKNVKSTVHQHHNGVCIDIILICSEGKVLQGFFSELKKNRAVKSINCSIL